MKAAIKKTPSRHARAAAAGFALLGLGAAGLGCTSALDSGGGRGSPGVGQGTDAVPAPGSSLPGTPGEPAGPLPGTVVPEDCNTPTAPRAPLRRLTRFEYNNSVRDLVGDASSPADALPGEPLGNGFGNDADSLAVSTLLAQQYMNVAEGVAQRATLPGVFETLVPCAVSATGAGEADCVRSFVEAFAARAYRRPVPADELNELMALYQSVRTGGTDFNGSVAALLEAILQGPDYLYRAEFGTPVEGRPDLLRPTGHEMATRLAYLFWGTLPDAALTAAAERGELGTAAGVAAQAARLLGDRRAEVVVEQFFDHVLPISALASLTRDPLSYPTFSPRIGSLMRQETQTFLRHFIFQGGGSFAAAYSAPFTFANEELATYYGIAEVKGPEFRQVALDTTKRLGLLTQGGVLSGPVHSNTTNPVSRGAFVMKKLLCKPIPPPSAEVAAAIKPPDPYEGSTARERFAQHSADVGCAACHALMDPIGLALENYDAVGLWRDTENGAPIDASGQVPALEGAFNGPVELAQRLAATTATQACLAEQWMTFAYGRVLRPADKCTVESVKSAFAESNYDVKSMLTALTQADAFLYLSAVRE